MLCTLHVCLHGWAGGGLGPLGQAGVGVAIAMVKLTKFLPTLQHFMHTPQLSSHFAQNTLVDKT